MLGFDISWAAFNVIEVMSSTKFTHKVCTHDGALLEKVLTLMMHIFMAEDRVLMCFSEFLRQH